MLPLMGNSMYHNRDLTQNDMNIMSSEINTPIIVDKYEYADKTESGEPMMAGVFTDSLNLESLSGLKNSLINMEKSTGNQN